MKYLITGGAGFIGSNLAIELENQGNEVVVLDNFMKGNEKNLEGFQGKIIKGNESKLSGLEEEFNGVFHLAATSDTTIKNREEMFSNNVEGFKLVLEFCKKNNCKLVYSSSAATYGNGPSPMREDQELKPLNVYAESKVEMEKIAEAASKGFSPKTLVGLRYFNVFGPREYFKGKMASMTYQLARQMKEGNIPRIFKYGEQERDHIYVKDAVRATIMAMSYQGFNIFNVATGIKTSFNQLIDYINEALETNFEPEYFNNPYIGSYQGITVADMSKTQKELGFKAKYSVREGIIDYIKWLDSIRWYNE